MFEKELKEKFKAIFDVKEVSFDQASDSAEQNVLFVEIESPNFSFSDGKAKAMVTGKGTIFGRNDSLTYGYFAKAIAKAGNALTKDLVFRDFESNSNRFRDIAERGFSFTYFFNSQHNPPTGTIDEVDITIEES